MLKLTVMEPDELMVEIYCDGLNEMGKNPVFGKACPCDGIFNGHSLLELLGVRRGVYPYRYCKVILSHHYA